MRSRQERFMSHSWNPKQWSQYKFLFDFFSVETFGKFFILFVITYQCKMDAACNKTRGIWKPSSDSFMKLYEEDRKVSRHPFLQTIIYSTGYFYEHLYSHYILTTKQGGKKKGNETEERNRHRSTPRGRERGGKRENFISKITGLHMHVSRMLWKCMSFIFNFLRRCKKTCSRVCSLLENSSYKWILVNIGSRWTIIRYNVVILGGLLVSENILRKKPGIRWNTEF